MRSRLERISKEQLSIDWLFKFLPSDHIKWGECWRLVNSWLDCVGRSGLDSTWH